MSAELTPAQRLAISRAKLAQALQEPLWLLLMTRCMQARTQAQAQPPSAPKH